jgi:hypothetical protein
MLAHLNETPHDTTRYVAEEPTSNNGDYYGRFPNGHPGDWILRDPAGSLFAMGREQEMRLWAHALNTCASGTGI